MLVRLDVVVVVVVKGVLVIVVAPVELLFSNVVKLKSRSPDPCRI